MRSIQNTNITSNSDLFYVHMTG